MAAVGMARICVVAFPPPKKDQPVSNIARVGFACGVLALVTSLAGSLLFVAVSRLNYPGGVALSKLVERINSSDSDKSPIVCVDVAAAMSGVSLFGQRAAMLSSPDRRWTFEKAGYETENALETTSTSCTHLLTERKELGEDFRVVDAVQGTPRIDFRHRRIIEKDAIYILEHRDWN